MGCSFVFQLSHKENLGMDQKVYIKNLVFGHKHPFKDDITFFFFFQTHSPFHIQNPVLTKESPDLACLLLC